MKKYISRIGLLLVESTASQLFQKLTQNWSKDKIHSSNKKCMIYIDVQQYF